MEAFFQGIVGKFPRGEFPVEDSISWDIFPGASNFELSYTLGSMHVKKLYKPIPHSSTFNDE